MEFILAAYLCIPAALRVRSQAVSCEGSPGKSCGCTINSYHFTLWQTSKLAFFVSQCVSSVFPLALTGLAFWTPEAGGVVGQDRRESSMDPASHTGPRRLSGRALQDQLADGCLRIMTRWHLQSEQAIRLTDSPWPTGEAKLPVLNPVVVVLLLLMPRIPQVTPTKPRRIAEVYWFAEFSTHREKKKRCENVLEKKIKKN